MLYIVNGILQGQFCIRNTLELYIGYGKLFDVNPFKWFKYKDANGGKIVNC